MPRMVIPQDRRSHARLTADMLTAVREAGETGMSQSEIAAAVRYAGSRIGKIARDLVAVGAFENPSKTDGRRLFITHYGVEVLCCYREFLEMVESYGLEP